MEIRKGILFFHFFVFILLLIGDDLQAPKFITASTTTIETNGTYPNSHTTRWIQEQINGTVNLCSDNLGTKWKNDNNNKPLHSNATLNVCVPKKLAFPEFVDVNEDGIVKGGFSIAIFCLVIQELPFRVRPIFKPSKSENYTETVQQLQEGKDCEAVAGDITITSNRTKLVDFTIPYMSSEIYMLVPATQKWNQNLVTLIRPFTPRLWLTLFCAGIFIGVAIGILEYRANNPEFRVPSYQKLIMILWFPISTFFFREGRIHNRFSKIVLVIWLTTIFIVIQIFTACLSSWLTVNQLQPKVPKECRVVGYQNGSYVENFVKNYVKNSPTVEELALSSVVGYKNVLDTGTVDAIFEELPYIDLFIAKYGDSNYKKFGPLGDEPGLAFAFSHGSRLQQEFSRGVVKVIESPDMTDMKNKYFRIQIPSPTQPTDDSLPQNLDVHSFFLLFIFMGLATIITIICSEFTLMRTAARISPEISIHIMSLVQTMCANSNQITENEH